MPDRAELLVQESSGSVSRSAPLRALQGMRHNAHDTSRRTTRSTVICSACDRTLRGSLDDRGNWHVAKHKGCIGHMLGGHKEVRDGC